MRGNSSLGEPALALPLVGVRDELRLDPAAQRRAQLLVLLGERGQEPARGRGRDALRVGGHGLRSCFFSIPKMPRMTSRWTCLPCAAVQDVADRVGDAARSGCLGRGAGAGGGGRGGRRPARRRRHPRGQQLARALGVGARAVARVQRGGLGGRVEVRLAGSMSDRVPGRPAVDDRGRHALLVEDRHDRLADAELLQQLLEVVEVALGVGLHGGAQRLLVVRRERAQRVLDAVAELAEHVGRDVLRRLGDEEDADALGADQPDRLRDRLDERLARVAEQQMRLVEEEDELGLARRRPPRAASRTARRAST